MCNPQNNNRFMELLTREVEGDETMVSYSLDNVIAAGRCISAESKPYASLRVQATLMSIGECAGVAASLACDKNEAVYALSLNELNKLINERGCVM